MNLIDPNEDDALEALGAAIEGRTGPAVPSAEPKPLYSAALRPLAALEQECFGGALADESAEHALSVVPVSAEVAAQIDAAAGIETVPVRMHRNTVAGLENLAKAQGTNLQVFLNRVLTGIAGADACNDVRRNTGVAQTLTLADGGRHG